MRVVCVMARGIAAILLALAFGGAVLGAETSGRDVAITILQTTDLHHHANGTDHVGLDVDPTNATSTIGAYARIAAYVNLVRATAGHAVVLVDSGAQAAAMLTEEFGLSQRQAYRYLQEAQAIKRPVPVSAPSVAVTVKVPEDIAMQLRVHAHATGSTIGDVVSRAVSALLARERRRG